MNKVSKNLLAGATALTIGASMVASVVPAFALNVQDGDVNGVNGATRTDLNNVSGAVSDSELVQITVEDVLSISVANPGMVTDVDADGNLTTVTTAPFDVLPGELGEDPTNPVLPGVTHQGGSSQIIKGNNPDGYYMSIMMCSKTNTTNFPTIATDVPDCKGGLDLMDADPAATHGISIKPTAAASTLSGAASATTGGFWGYRFSVADSTGISAGVPSGNWAAVGAFTDTATWGAKIADLAQAGVAAVNINYGVVTNTILPAGTYNNYVIYTAVNN